MLDSSCSLEEGNNLALTQDDIDEMEDSTSSVMGAGSVANHDDMMGEPDMVDYDDDASSTSSRLMIAE